MQITKRKVLAYMLLPQIMPRIKMLFQSGFGYLAFLMAQIYRTAGILPATHPYLSTVNLGRYGIRHVIVEASRQLEFSRKNIDQIIVFFLLVFAIIILFVQFFLLIVSMFTLASFAAAPPVLDPGTFNNFQQFFGIDPAIRPDGETYDLAFIILDQVFGLQDFFGSCVSQTLPCFIGNSENAGLQIIEYPYPFHFALQDAFTVYSVGLLVIGLLIFVYFLFAVVAETAQSGTPFGQRFNHVWAPIRMVVAFGLLIPVAQGFNSGQWIVFYSAKFGSNFASNGWTVFLGNAVDGQAAMIGDGDQLVATPKPPTLNTMLEFTTILATCIRAHQFIYQEDDNNPAREIGAYLYNPDIAGVKALELEATDIQTAVEHFARNEVPRDIHITFGDFEKHKDIESGDVAVNRDIVQPYCGSLVLPVTDWVEAGSVGPEHDSPGSRVMITRWYNLIQMLWADAQFSLNLADYQCSGDPDLDYDSFFFGENFGVMGECIARKYLNGYAEARGAPGNGATANEAKPPRSIDLANNRAMYSELVGGNPPAGSGFTVSFIEEAVLAQSANNVWYKDQLRYGWAGAAIWYNKIAQLNGALIGAVSNIPYVKNYPAVMEEVYQQKLNADANFSPEEKFNPTVSDGETIDTLNKSDEPIALVLYLSQDLWKGNYLDYARSNNAYLDVINFIFGTEGLFNIQDNIANGVHPLASLSAIGKSLVESSLRMLGGAIGTGILGAALSGSGIGTVSDVVSGFALQVGTMGLSIGFVLFYILPFLPFIYFFFAVGGWVKGIFEAMVGIPLWALAHIRIDGNGLPGDAALQGYYLILEVFLRPIMIIFGLVASVIIFSAQVNILQEIWGLVTSNVLGFDESCQVGGTCPPAGETGAVQYLRGAVDNFFFTVVFAVVVYIIGMSSFKLVDSIPNHILRWMGANVSTFGDQNEDQAQSIVQNATIGGQMAGSSVQQGLGGMTGSMKSAKGMIGGLAGRGGSGGQQGG